MDRVRYISRSDACGTRKQVWSKCPDCGLARWVFPRNSGVCRPCFARRKGKAQRVYGKRIVDKSTGYVRVRVFPDEPFGEMGGNNHWVFEHRFVMAKHLGRTLYPTELVHHINGVRTDNRLSNLVLTTTKEHEHKTLLRTQAERIQELESEVSALRGRSIPCPP